MRRKCIRAVVLFVGSVIALVSVQRVSAGGIDTTDPTLPPNLVPPGFYGYFGPAQVHPTYNVPGLQVVLQDTNHHAFSSIVQTPQGADEQEQFNSDLDGNVSVNGGLLSPLHIFGAVTTKVIGKTGNVTGTFNTEMLALNLIGNINGNPAMVRESPTLPSTGQTTITDIGGGNFHIDSFFDVFTELSVDGGQSWIPDSNGPSHVILDLPEPGTLGIVMLCGLVGLAPRRRA